MGDRVVLYPVGLDPVALTPVDMDPGGYNLGPDVVVNGDFGLVSLGAELLTSPNFTATTGWATQAAWSISTGAGTATHDGTAAGNLSTNDAPVTAYTPVCIETEVDEYNQSTNCEIRDTFLSQKRAIRETPGTDYVYDNAAGSSPTNFALRGKGTDSATIVLSRISVKNTSLDSFVELGTMTATAYNYYDPDAGTVRIVSGGATMGISQGGLTPGRYFYCIDAQAANSGTAILSTDADGTLVTINAAGYTQGVADITDTTFKLQAGAGGGDFLFNSICLKPVLQ